MIYDMILQYKIIIYDIVYDIMYDKYRILPAGQVGLPFRQCTGYLARMSSCSLVICLKMKTRAIMGHLIPTMMPIGSMVGVLLHGLIHWIRCPTSSRSCKGYLLCLALIFRPSLLICRFQMMVMWICLLSNSDTGRPRQSRRTPSRKRPEPEHSA